MKKAMVMFAAALVSAFVFCGCSNESALEESAIPVVSSIISENGFTAKCTAVDIQEKISDNKYSANATLDNGNTIKIIIEDRGDQIYVTIPLNQ